MPNYKRIRKIGLFWLKLLVWLVVLSGLVILQSGAFQPLEVAASINVAATVNEPTLEKVLPASGSATGNTMVSLKGTNFDDVIGVSFAGASATSFTIESPTSISALTPPGHPGPVKVVVLTKDKTASLENGFTYKITVSPTNLPSPTITSTTEATATSPASTITSPATVSPSAGANLTPTSTLTATQTAVSPSVIPTVTIAPTTPNLTPATTQAANSTTTPEGATEPISTTTPVAPTSTLTPPASATPSPTLTVVPTPSPTLTVVPTASPTLTVVPTPSPTTTVIATTTPSLSVNPTPTIIVTPTIITSPLPTSTELAQPSATATTINYTPTNTSSVSPSVIASTVGASPSVVPQVTATLPPETASPTEIATITAIIAPTPTHFVVPTSTPTPVSSPSPSPSPIPLGPPTITKISPVNGPVTGGTTIIIQGTNFSASNLVTFGGLDPASVTVNSPTQITVVTAAQQAGVVSIIIKNEAGLVAVNNGFTYTSKGVVLSQSPTNFNYSGKITGNVLTLKSSFSVGVDASGDNANGWHLVASSTVLRSDKAIIPVNSHTIQGVKVVTKSGSPPKNMVSFPLIFPISDATIFRAEAGSGSGESIITFETQLLIPSDLPAGNYKLTLNVSVESGPF